MVRGRKTKYKEKLRITSFSIEPTLLKKVEELASQVGKSRNEIIREALISFLRGGKNGWETEKIQ